METLTRPGIAAMTAELPKPYNRGLIVENPMYEFAQSSPLLLEGVDTSGLFDKKVNDAFPNGIIPMKIVAIADDVTGISVGDYVIMNPNATHRGMPIMKKADENAAKYIYYTSGDIAAIYHKAKANKIID